MRVSDDGKRIEVLLKSSVLARSTLLLGFFSALSIGFVAFASAERFSVISVFGVVAGIGAVGFALAAIRSWQDRYTFQQSSIVRVVGAGGLGGHHLIAIGEPRAVRATRIDGVEFSHWVVYVEGTAQCCRIVLPGGQADADYLCRVLGRFYGV